MSALSNLCSTRNSPFAPESDNSPIIPIRIRLLLHLGRKRNSTHDPIPKLLVENRLVRIPVILHNLVQPVDQGLLGRHLNGATAVREAAQLLFENLGRDIEELGEFPDVFWGGLGLAVEEGCCGDFIAADVLGDLLEAELLLGLGFEEGGSGCWEVRVLGGLGLVR